MKREKEKKLNQAFYQGSWKRDSAKPKAGIDGERPAAWRRGSDKRRGVGGGPRKDRGVKKERRMNATMRDQLFHNHFMKISIIFGAKSQEI